jgi:small redox-active disulfide protein 2
MATKRIEILGTGCPKCKALDAATREAVAQLGMDAEVCKVERIEQIVERGVMVTPALSVDGVVKSSGRVLSVEDIKKLLA